MMMIKLMVLLMVTFLGEPVCESEQEHDSATHGEMYVAPTRLHGPHLQRVPVHSILPEGRRRAA